MQGVPLDDQVHGPEYRIAERRCRRGRVPLPRWRCRDVEWLDFDVVDVPLGGGVFGWFYTRQLRYAAYVVFCAKDSRLYFDILRRVSEGYLAFEKSWAVCVGRETWEESWRLRPTNRLHTTRYETRQTAIQSDCKMASKMATRILAGPRLRMMAEQSRTRTPVPTPTRLFATDHVPPPSSPAPQQPQREPKSRAVRPNPIPTAFNVSLGLDN